MQRSAAAAAAWRRERRHHARGTIRTFYTMHQAHPLPGNNGRGHGGVFPSVKTVSRYIILYRLNTTPLYLLSSISPVRKRHDTLTTKRTKQEINVELRRGGTNKTLHNDVIIMKSDTCRFLWGNSICFQSTCSL